MTLLNEREEPNRYRAGPLIAPGSHARAVRQSTPVHALNHADEFIATRAPKIARVPEVAHLEMLVHIAAEDVVAEQDIAVAASNQDNLYL